jgi:hypothetical protein
MLIDQGTLPSFEDFDAFEVAFLGYAKETALDGLLSPVLSKRRLFDAHYAWLDDIKRVANHEPQIDAELDHFKQCGHLAYWLRRQAPVIDLVDIVEAYGEEGGLYAEEEEQRSILEKYSGEYLAFDFGLQICHFYESERLDREERREPRIDLEYLMTVCNFMKFKHVSPHSLFLIYKSLFL